MGYGIEISISRSFLLSQISFLILSWLLSDHDSRDKTWDTQLSECISNGKLIDSIQSKNM
jgi:hypothetical protein